MANNPKRPRLPNQLAKMIVDITSGDLTDTLPSPKNEGHAGHGQKERQGSGCVHVASATRGNPAKGYGLAVVQITIARSVFSD